MPAIGIDFGTSNSAAAIWSDGRARLIPLAPDQETVPTAVFLDYAARRTLFGGAAVAAMIEGREGRFMRALKSILGTSLARESRQFMNRRMSLLDLIAEFLSHIRARAEAETGRSVTRAVAGRPVHFHSADPARDAQAERDLRACYLNAGFDEVRFLAEPEAAALASGAGDGIGLIVDIGGGTSDFTLFEGRGGDRRILASHGIRLGGTNFDKALSLAKVMPLLGHGGELRNELGSGRHAVPQALFHELASWEKIAFVYSPATLRDARRMARLAVDPARLARLVSVLEQELGHDIAFAVEAAKIGANAGGAAPIELGMIEAGLRPVLDGPELSSLLWPMAAEIDAALGAVLAQADLAADRIARVIFVGGSSLVGVIDQLTRARFPGARIERSDVFTAVVRGLALASAPEDGVSDRP